MRRLMIAALLALSCSPAATSLDGGNEPDPAERGLFEHGGGEVASSQAMTQLADSLFQFDPTIVPGADAPQNAQNIHRDVGVQLNGCGSAAINGVTVTVQKKFKLQTEAEAGTDADARGAKWVGEGAPEREK